MHLTVKLYASLGQYLPASAVKNKLEVEVPQDTTPNQILQRFNVPQELAHLVLINGVFTLPKERNNKVLQEDDVLAVWPPIAGG